MMNERLPHIRKAPLLIQTIGFIRYQPSANDSTNLKDHENNLKKLNKELIRNKIDPETSIRADYTNEKTIYGL
jgi:hypothetical protein